MTVPEPLLRYRLVVVALVTLGAGLLDLGYQTADWQVFIDAGHTMLSGGWRDTFADATVQAGPLLLLLAATADRFGELTGIPARTSIAVLTYAAASFGAIAVYRSLCRTFERRPVPTVELTAPVFVLLFGLPSESFLAGHSAHIWIPLLWLLAGSSVVRGRVVVGGLLVAAAAGIETWGVLGVTVLVLAPSIRGVIAGMMAAGVGVAALFGPFFVVGTARTGDYVWHVNPAAPIAVLGGYERVGWAFRIVQGTTAVVVGAAGGFVARRRVSMSAVLAVLLLTLAVRLALDPLSFADYYYVSARFIGIWLSAVLIAERRIAAVPAIVATYLMLVAGPTPHLVVLGVVVPVAIYLAVRGDPPRAATNERVAPRTATAIQEPSDAASPVASNRT